MGKADLARIGMSLIEIAMDTLEVDGAPIFTLVHRARRPAILSASGNLLECMQRYDAVMSEATRPGSMRDPAEALTPVNSGGYHTAPGVPRPHGQGARQAAAGQVHAEGDARRLPCR